MNLRGRGGATGHRARGAVLTQHAVQPSETQVQTVPDIAPEPARQAAWVVMGTVAAVILLAIMVLLMPSRANTAAPGEAPRPTAAQAR